MKTDKQKINGKEYDVLLAEEGHTLQIKAEFSKTGKEIQMGDKLVLGINYWVKDNPIEDREEFYEEIKILEIKD